MSISKIKNGLYVPKKEAIYNRAKIAAGGD